MFDVLKSFCLTNHLQKGQISMSIMKCFIIKEHIVINDSLIYTVQKCKVKLLYFHRSLFDYRLSQIPGQSESQELHFGHLYVFLLQRQKHSNKKMKQSSKTSRVTAAYMSS